MDWHDLKLIGTILAGLALSVMMSKTRSWASATTTVAIGGFASFVGTEPVLHVAGWSGDQGYTYLVAGLLAMFGERLARRGGQLIDKFEIPRFGK